MLYLPQIIPQCHHKSNVASLLSNCRLQIKTKAAEEIKKNQMIYLSSTTCMQQTLASSSSSSSFSSFILILMPWIESSNGGQGITSYIFLFIYKTNPQKKENQPRNGSHFKS